MPGPTTPSSKPCDEKADLARDAVYDGDFVALGKAMSANTEAQRNLHPALVSAEAQQIIEIAEKHGALGWKVNGAGGEGGSFDHSQRLLMSQKRNMIQAIEQTNPLFQNIPVYLSRFGLRVWTREPEGGED
jgi:D-glycero-alpha-D-manno-heptose-7-phosphate kinase